MYRLTGAICINMQEKLIQKYEVINKVIKSKCEVIKQLSTGICKRILETWWLRKNNQGRPPKLSVPQKTNILRQTKRLQEEMGNLFFVKKE